MANGTINLVNNSTALTGVGSKFLTEVTSGDFVYVEVGTVPYTLPVDKVNSDTSITLLRRFSGPTTNGLAWTLIPRRAQYSVVAALADHVAEAIRLSLNNENNWQKLLTENGNVTITRPDGSTYTGPSWVYLLNNTLKLSDIGLEGPRHLADLNDFSSGFWRILSTTLNNSTGFDGGGFISGFDSSPTYVGLFINPSNRSVMVGGKPLGKEWAWTNLIKQGDYGLGGTAPRTPAVTVNSYDNIPTGLSSGFWTHPVTGGPYAYTITLMQDGGGVKNARHLIIPASNTGRIALRWDDGNKLDYQYFYTDKNKPTFTDVGAVPYRGAINDVDLNNVRGTQYGRFCQPMTANATAARHYPITEAGALDVHQTSANGAEGCVQEYRTFSSRRTFTRSFNPTGAIWTAWAEFFTTGNTTKASDGTLKAASPIVKLFADGSFEINEESEGATVTRLDVGQYLIEGCEALNSDAAWGGIDGGFDIPTDRNKQPLIWLDYDVNPDGSILVKTYHRTHPDSPEFARNRIGYKNDAGDFIETVANGEPVDIPSDQFVSVRVEMPQNSIWNVRQRELEEAMEAERVAAEAAAAAENKPAEDADQAIK